MDQYFKNELMRVLALPFWSRLLLFMDFYIASNCTLKQISNDIASANNFCILQDAKNLRTILRIYQNLETEKYCIYNMCHMRSGYHK